MPITTNDITGTLAFLVQPDLKEGVAIYTGTTDYALHGILLLNVVETVRVTQPDGFTLPPVTVNPAAGRTASINLIPNADGIINGAYTLEVTAVVTGLTDPGTYASRGYRFELNACGLVPAVTSKVSCSCGWLEAADATDWTGWTIVSRTLTITPPPVPGAWPPVTTSIAKVNTGTRPLYNKKTYTINLLVTATRGTTTVENLAASMEVKVDCAGLCEMACAMGRLVSFWQEAKGVNHQKAEQYKDAIQTASALYQLYAAQLDCGLAGEDAMAAFRKLLADLGIDGDCCDCCEGDMLVKATCGGATPEGTSYTFDTYPDDILAVQVTGNDVLHSITPDFEAILRNTYNTVVISSDNSVTVTPDVAEALPPVTIYDLSVAGQEKYWYFTLTVLFDTVNGLIDSWTVASQRKFPATGFWSPADPVVDSGMTGAISNMRIRNLFDNPVEVDPLLKWNVQMVLQNPTPANRFPTININAIAGVLFQSLVAAAGSTAVVLLFEDRRIHSNQYGDIAWPFTGASNTVATTLESITFNVELRTV